MTTGAEYSSTQIDQLSEDVQEEAASPLADLVQRAEDSRVPEGAFSILEPGNAAQGMTDGIVDRLQARLEELGDTFGDMSDLLDSSASTYQEIDDENKRDVEDIHPE